MLRRGGSYHEGGYTAGLFVVVLNDAGTSVNVVMRILLFRGGYNGNGPAAGFFKLNVALSSSDTRDHIGFILCNSCTNVVS